MEYKGDDVTGAGRADGDVHPLETTAALEKNNDKTGAIFRMFHCWRTI
jgi:hypothetical protein